MKFAGRLVVGTVLILLVTVLVLVWTAEVSLRRDLENEFAAGLEREARLVRSALPLNQEEWGPLIKRFAAENAHRITLIDRSGNVVEDSEVPENQLASLENHRDRAEVRDALGGRTGRDSRGSTSVGRRLMYVAIPGGTGVVRVAADLGQVTQTVRRAQGSVLLAALLALLLGSILAYFTGRAVARPLTEITMAADVIAGGSTPRFPHSGIPDIDRLVRALRQMHLQLTERFEALQRKQSETAAMVDSMAEGVIAANHKGRIITANEAARRMLGYESAVALPELAQLFREKSARAIVDEAIQGGTVQAQELEFEGRTLSLSARPLPEGGTVLVLYDLTEIRRLEAVRRDFVANVSHELKTPLTSISGYSETLLGDPPDAETTQRFLHVIVGNARRMQRLVDNLLDLSRIESGGWKPRLEVVDLATVIGGVIEDCSGKSVAEHISIVMDIAEDARSLVADEDAVRQVVFNLVDNALRYTPRGGTITCRAGLEGELIAIRVTDSGSGIAREHLPRIFERFYRIDSSRSRDEGGTGLGLAIVRHLVEAHGGRVRAESVVGKGTTITAYFPTMLRPDAEITA
jgi:two-component system phosphate regulon sensor histidine kinase PhoR